MKTLTKASLTASLVAAAALALYGTQDAPDSTTCALHTVFAPCDQLQLLDHPENVPACDGTETVGAVLAIRLDGQPADADPLQGWLQPPGLVVSPIDCGDYTWADPVQVVPTETMHPHSIAGMVGRHATEWSPEEPPHLGYEYGAGAYCAGDCEYVAVGASDREYWLKRLCRSWPDAPDCPTTEDATP